MSESNTPVPVAERQTVQAVSRPAVVIPQVPIMSKQTYSSAMSYVGFTRRMTAWVRKTGTTPVKAALAWTAGLTAAAAMYGVITVWYFFTVVLFGFFTIPFRLIRRGHRKQEHLQKTQLATMQAMLVTQQQSMMENRDRGL